MGTDRRDRDAVNASATSRYLSGHLSPGESVRWTLVGKEDSGFNVRILAGTEVRLFQVDLTRTPSYRVFPYAAIQSLRYEPSRLTGRKVYVFGPSGLVTMAWIDRDEASHVEGVLEIAHATLRDAPAAATVGTASGALTSGAGILMSGARSMPGGEEGLLMEVQGAGGWIWLFEHKVRIKHSGFRGAFTQGILKGDKELWIDQISGIQWREPGSMFLGHIQFTLIGGSTDSRSAPNDENALQFGMEQREAFAALKVEVERLIRRSRSGASAPPAAVAEDVQRLLREIAGLRDAGILTDAEYEAKKADLLKRL